jgi:hypothetical protein
VVRGTRERLQNRDNKSLRRLIGVMFLVYPPKRDEQLGRMIRKPITPKKKRKYFVLLQKIDGFVAWW